MSDLKNISVSWPTPANPKTQKKAQPTSLQPVIQAVVNGGDYANSTYPLHVMPKDPEQPGARGTAVFVPTIDYYFMLTYVSGEYGDTPIALPPVQGILVIDLPKGIFTSASEIDEAIGGGTGGGGDPGTVGPNSPH